MTLPAPMTLNCAAGSATVYEHGAQLTSWIPTGQAPVIWMSSAARFEPGVAIRGGVPIVFPWFGAGRQGDQSPAHGFARLRPWRLLESRTESSAAVAVFTLEGEGDPSFPFAYAVRYEIYVGETLRLALAVENRDSRPFSFEAALHAYLAVGDVRDVSVTGLDGSPYLDQVPADMPSRKVQDGDVTITEETDRIYSSSAQVCMVDRRLGRRLVIDKQHSASTVVWNPWVEKARSLSDFGNDEWTAMLCVEGGNLREAAVFLDPGERHEMRYTIEVERLA